MSKKLYAPNVVSYFLFKPEIRIFQVCYNFQSSCCKSCHEPECDAVGIDYTSNKTKSFKESMRQLRQIATLEAKIEAANKILEDYEGRDWNFIKRLKNALLIPQKEELRKKGKQKFIQAMNALKTEECKPFVPVLPREEEDSVELLHRYRNEYEEQGNEENTHEN